MLQQNGYLHAFEQNKQPSIDIRIDSILSNVVKLLFYVVIKIKLVIKLF